MWNSRNPTPVSPLTAIRIFRKIVVRLPRALVINAFGAVLWLDIRPSESWIARIGYVTTRDKVVPRSVTISGIRWRRFVSPTRPLQAAPGPARVTSGVCSRTSIQAQESIHAGGDDGPDLVLR